MKQKISHAQEKFLQRRYGVRLGRRYVLAAAGVVLMGVLGCSQVNSNTSAFAQSPLPQSESPVSEGKLNSDNPDNPDNPDNRLVTANTKFGFKLFSEVLKQDSDKNIFLSPSSIAIALAMTYNGASGSTKKAMAKALELKSLNLEQINSANAVLKSFLSNPDPAIKITIANSLWANRDAKFKPEFLQTNQDVYTAKVTNLNFRDPQATEIINNWVNENTSGKINKVVETIDPEQVLLLINAIYFKGSWANKFDQQQTANYPFNLTSGQQKQLPMMSQTGKYRYYENEKFQAVSLPYGKNGKVSFYVFLPRPKSSLPDLYQNLNSENWEKWMTQFSKREGFIRLPRFKMNYDVTLNQALKALGMGEALSAKADFSNMGDGHFAISEVKHKTFVEVNEEGTEAAAVTSVGIRVTSAFQQLEPFRFVVDRPFFFAIRENYTGSVLFMGSIVEPHS